MTNNTIRFVLNWQWWKFLRLPLLSPLWPAISKLNQYKILNYRFGSYSTNGRLLLYRTSLQLLSRCNFWLCHNTEVIILSFTRDKKWKYIDFRTENLNEWWLGSFPVYIPLSEFLKRLRALDPAVDSYSSVGAFSSNFRMHRIAKLYKIRWKITILLHTPSPHRKTSWVTGFLNFCLQPAIAAKLWIF